MQSSTCDLVINDALSKKRNLSVDDFAFEKNSNKQLKSAPNGLNLKPKLGLFSGIGLVVGNMIGKYIFNMLTLIVFTLKY